MTTTHPWNGLADHSAIALECAKEPIHIPGAVQSHGILMVLNPQASMIEQISENTLNHLKVEWSRLLNQPLTEIFTEEESRLIAASVPAGDSQPRLILTRQWEESRYYDVFIHRCKNHVILEMEPAPAPDNRSSLSLEWGLKDKVLEMNNTSGSVALFSMMTEEIRGMTGFDRVLLYRFDEEWNGEVVAESAREELPSYRGMHYPAADIPEQARNLYKMNWLRHVPDVEAAPARIMPKVNPRTNQPVDLSFSLLRSSSPVHIEYLKTMKVGGSFTLSIVHNDQLWGLITCHHATARRLPEEVRAACLLLTRLASSELSVMLMKDEAEYKSRLNDFKSQLLKSLYEENNIIQGLKKHCDTLMNLVAATGLVVQLGGDLIIMGQTPDGDEINDLLETLREKIIETGVYETNRLGAVHPPARQYEDVASGLLALSLSKWSNDVIMWFRPETPQTVIWGRDPKKVPRVEERNGIWQITSPHEFGIHREITRGKSTPWHVVELETVKDFKDSLIDVFLRQTYELAKLNVELEKARSISEIANRKKSQFLAMMSHEFRTPLNAISGYAEMLDYEYVGPLNEKQRSYTHNIITSSHHLLDLVNDLLDYAKIEAGKIYLELELVPVDPLVDEIRGIVKELADRKDVTVHFQVGPGVRFIQADPVRLRQILLNLITNAIKFNKPGGSVWVSFHQVLELPGKPEYIESIVCRVKDTGIGIAKEDLEELFSDFYQVAGPMTRGQEGTGLGLAVTRKLVELHGGCISVESEVGKGSTFTIQLPSVVQSSSQNHQ